MAPTDPTNTPDRPNAYEMRKKAVDFAAAQLVFDRNFAVDAFSSGYSAGRGKALPKNLTAAIVDRIDRDGHARLAQLCLAFLLAHENANEGLDKLAYLSCLRTIRDGANMIAQAADELVGQMQRHKIETNEVEPVRAETLHRLAEALHGRFRAEMGEDQFDDLISPKLIGNPLSDLRMTPGLPGIAALHNEVESIREEYVRAQKQPRQKGVGPVGMRPGNKPNREQKAFIRDLATLYEEILASQPTAYDTASGPSSPFLRFIQRVFREFREQSEVPVDPHGYYPPSVGTVRNVLQSR